ncbi:MAG TPA: class I SAM-dependent methyltransferase [Pseudolabrys sp.]
MTPKAVCCRFCGSLDLAEVLDLGAQPPSNSFLAEDRLLEPEPHYALILLHCGQCGLVQVPAAASAHEIFSDYVYFSSYSDSWLDHARRYVDTVVRRFGLGSQSQVVEIASNDGYLLQYVTAKGIPALGIEPADNVADAARRKGVETLVEFFSLDLAKRLAGQGRRADLVIGNNVLAHVPPLNDFVAGLHHLLKPDGVITMEFPHLVQLVEQLQFDTIYHEHYSYYSLIVAEKIFAAHGLRIFDVELLPTHGGSLRIYACHADAGHRQMPSVEHLRQEEIRDGFDRRDVYLDFGCKIYALKRDLLDFFIEKKREGRSIAGYGAAAKGNTLLNFLGVRSDFVDFVVDRNPAKQGKYLPGSRIPVLAPEAIAQRRPDFLVILPWNLRDEIAGQMASIRGWGGQFVTLIPKVSVF